ncbi:hypothetical protein KIN20_005970 [Parelaphostrongylus tenuis]|uniref:Uncharacterized protein n=1 Tax=Parelaphostrongylus tenuis TaxID=148309 RepID=A0AAD5QKM4_PARTN|nr:hypothetical protein KIN20_005970 [Parelaphostrongylus tenuis]
MDEIRSLCEQFSRQKYEHPEKSKDPFRNEFRELFCAGAICEKLDVQLSSRLGSEQELRNSRSHSLNEMLSLCQRLGGLVKENLASEN